MANKHPVIIDNDTGGVFTQPPKVTRYRAKLDTMQDVRREMAKVYREARSGVVEVVDGTKLVWMLQAVGKVIEGSDLEKRIEVLEGKK
jgi:signal transduction protein with GAF and PtsI domain